MSDLAMANVEALADNESIYDYRYPKQLHAICRKVLGIQLV